MPIPRIKQLKEFLLKRISPRKLYGLVWNNPDMFQGIKEANLGKATRDEEREEIIDFFDRDGWKKAKGSISPLQQYLADSNRDKVPMRVLVFNDGFTVPEYDLEDFELEPEWEEKKWMETHITISITGIIRNYMNSELADFKLRKFRMFEKNEHRLLEMIAEGDYESITINFRDQNMHSLELVKNQDVKKRIV